MWNDVRFALRLWRRFPGTAAIVVISVALGIARTYPFGASSNRLLDGARSQVPSHNRAAGAGPF